MEQRTRSTFLILAIFGAAPGAAEPVRLATTAFGASAEIEIRDLPRGEAEAAAREGLEIIFDIGRLADPALSIPGGVGALNRGAGEALRPVAESVAELLLRGLQICLWSGGAHGPLGGELYRLWGPATRGPATRGEEEIPEPGDLWTALSAAGCSRLSLSRGEEPAAAIAAGSRLDLSWMARGFALDRALERLRELGVTNAWLQVGPVYRALGGGPDGRGWLLTLPPAAADGEPIDRLWLRDQALAIATREPVEGSPARLIDQRTGVPVRGVVAVVVVADQAWDAEALAAALFILGQREGQLRLGGYQPRPSILWLLGEKGTPLQSTYRWSELHRVPRPR